MKYILLGSIALTAMLVSSHACTALTYPVIDTGQTSCYNNRAAINAPKPGQPFYGQDAQHPGLAPSYTANSNGTVSDRVTGLTWVKARGQKMTWETAVAGASKCRVGGFNDWRMPSIKELYSLINFNGYCWMSAAESRPYIDPKYFDFVYGDESKGYRIIDSQDWSGTQYIGKTMVGSPTVFGVNFADGRIKGYGKAFPNGQANMLYVRYVRGNPVYGENLFTDNGNGTITDSATGLMWQKSDSGKGMNWEQALAYASTAKLAAHSDWRLPNAKELHSIVDYKRAPVETKSAAISALFDTTKLADGDYPYFWTSTTHLDGPPDQRGSAAIYIAFGRATGYMSFPPGSGSYWLVDVHGAGAQRSDPKVGNPQDYPYGRGPQGDVIRIYNYVRLVRDARN